ARSTTRPSSWTPPRLRPTAPSPPRRTTRTGPGTLPAGKDPPGRVLKAGGGRPAGKTALADGMTHHSHHRLGGDRVGGGIARLKVPRPQEPAVDVRGMSEVALLSGGDHLGDVHARPVRRHADHADGP